MEDLTKSPDEPDTWIRTVKRHGLTFTFLALAWSHLNVANGTGMQVLFVLSLALAFDNFVLAVGGIRLVPRFVLEYFGRIRYFVKAFAWPYFLSYAFALGRKCGWVLEETADNWEELLTSIAIFATVIFVARELMWFIRGPPLSMNDPAELPRYGDCLASNSIFGGVFGINKHEAQDDRVVFVPMPEREGIAIPSGICVLEHTFMGLNILISSGEYSMFLCAMATTVARVTTNLKYQGRKTVIARILPRIGEAFWLWGCLWQEQCDAPLPPPTA